MPATPMHNANRKPMKARTARAPIGGWWPGTRTLLTAAGRNVVSTGGTDGPAAKSDDCESEGRLMASCALSERATMTTSGAISRTSCGSFCSGVSVERIGTPYSVQCHPHRAAGGFARDRHRSARQLQSGLAKARRYGEEYRAVVGDSFREPGNSAPAR